MKCTVHRHILAWSSALLLLFLTACGGGAGPDYSQEGVEVSVFASLGTSASSLSTQGVPVNPATGETGVDRAELEVFSGETRLFFRDRRIVDEAEGEAVALTPEQSEATLFLPEGSYRFALTALDGQDNALARGQVEQQVSADSRVSVPLTSLIGSARFIVPESVTANAVFDAFLEVSPPNRPDLRVPLGDFTASYEVAEPSVQLEGASNLGVRVAAACDVVEITATADNDLSEEVSASASVSVNDEACEGAGGGGETPVGADLVPPFVSIKRPEADSTVGKDFTLQGDVNDQQSGVDKVEVYEGTLKLGEADIDNDSMMWSFDASLAEGSYTLIAVAFDQAGNSWGAETQLTVREGAGGDGDNGDGQEVCTNPVNVPDEILERAIREALGQQADDLTCEDLASLTELDYNFGEGDAGIFDLEGLQYAVNLEVLKFTEFDNLADPESNVRDLAPLANLTKLRVIDFTAGGVEDLSPLEKLVNLEEVRLPRGSVSDISVVQSLTKLEILNLSAQQIGDLSPLQGLTGLKELYLSKNQIGDLSPLGNLTDLDRLFLGNNQISDLSPLQGLPNLSYLELSENRVEDVAALFSNSGLGRGDIINLEFNLLETCPGTQDRADLDALRERGAEVLFFVPQNCGGEAGGDCTQAVDVPDPVLERELRARLNKSEAEGPLTCGDLESFSELVIELGDVNDLSQEVASLEGLQFATNLRVLEITGAVSIEGSLGPLQGLETLERLVLQNVDCGNEEVIEALRERGVEVQIIRESDCDGGGRRR